MTWSHVHIIFLCFSTYFLYCDQHCDQSCNIANNIVKKSIYDVLPNSRLHVTNGRSRFVYRNLTIIRETKTKLTSAPFNQSSSRRYLHYSQVFIPTIPRVSVNMVNESSKKHFSRKHFFHIKLYFKENNKNNGMITIISSVSELI